MKVYVVLDNIIGKKPRVFSNFKKAKEFCKKETESYLIFAPEEQEDIGDLEITNNGIEDLFIIEEITIDNDADYEWGNIK